MLYEPKESLAELRKIEKDLAKRLEATKKELTQIEEDLELVRNVIWLKKNNKKNSAIDNFKRGTGIKESQIPLHYETTMLQDKKVIYVLNELKEASVKEIAEYMHKKEKDSDAKSMYLRAQQVVLRLHKQNKLIRIGDYASKYKLNITK